jgi:hypothetical protein
VIKSAGGREATKAGDMRWLNTVLINVKRSLDGTCHAFKLSAHIHRQLHNPKIDPFLLHSGQPTDDTALTA